MDERLLKAALDAGFGKAAFLDPQSLRPVPEVREYCAENKCGKYGANWTCPPRCGSLEECSALLRSFSAGVLVQTLGVLRDPSDYEGMLETGRKHADNFRRFCALVREEYPAALCLGAGGCSICEECAYPRACRFPELKTFSMEGFGLMVADVCDGCGLPYYYGCGTISYCACVLF